MVNAMEGKREKGRSGRVITKSTTHNNMKAGGPGSTSIYLSIVGGGMTETSYIKDCDTRSSLKNGIFADRAVV